MATNEEFDDELDALLQGETCHLRVHGVPCAVVVAVVRVVLSGRVFEL
jgi:antitoxin (DNA-binding transcriptional repressor) of toxin-antitoxin stability system